MLRPNQLGIALRFLRTARSLQQQQVAESAGITGSMLSGYENGRKEPTLASLEKILQAMGCNLRDLVRSLELAGAEVGPSADGASTSDQGVPAFSLADSWPAESRGSSRAFDLHAILGTNPRLELEERQAFEEMLSGYYRWLRFLYRRGVALPAAEILGQDCETACPESPARRHIQGTGQGHAEKTPGGWSDSENHSRDKMHKSSSKGTL